MAIRIKQIGLWRTEVPHRPGALAQALEPLAQQGADLKVVRVRTAAGKTRRKVIEIYAGEGHRATMMARAAGFSLSASTTLLLQGDNRPGFAYEVANAVAWAGIGIKDHEAGVVETQFSSTLTFDSEAEASEAAKVIRKVARSRSTRTPTRR